MDWSIFHSQNRHGWQTDRSARLGSGCFKYGQRQALAGYINDTKAAKRANENKAFEGAIDDTIAKIGAENTSLNGFSHGGYFDTRYLNHRVRANLPMLDTVVHGSQWA